MPEDVARDEPADVDAWLREIRDRGWTQCDWFANVTEGAGVGVGVGDAGDTDIDNEAQAGDDEEGLSIQRTLSPSDGLMTGLSTMVGPSSLLSFPLSHP